MRNRGGRYALLMMIMHSLSTTFFEIFCGFFRGVGDAAPYIRTIGSHCVGAGVPQGYLFHCVLDSPK